MGARGWARRVEGRLRVEGHPGLVSVSPHHSVWSWPCCPGPSLSLPSVKPGDRVPWQPAAVEGPARGLAPAVEGRLSGHPARRSPVAQQSTRSPHTPATCHTSSPPGPLPGARKWAGLGQVLGPGQPHL